MVEGTNVVERQKEIISVMRTILDNFIIAAKNISREVVRARYSHLSNEHFEQIQGKRLLCTGFGLAFESALKKKGIPCKHLFIYHEPFVLDGFSKKHHTGKAVGFNKRYMSLVKENKLIEAEKEVSDYALGVGNRYTAKRRHVHCVVEVSVGRDDLLVDPTVGLSYGCTKEDLIRGADVFKSYLYLDQVDYLMSNIHIGMPSLFYTTSCFWRSVYHISAHEKSISW